MIFKSNSDTYKNAYLNWQKGSRNSDEHFELYAKHFKESADKLVDDIGDNNGHIADQYIIPILFLYRHSIELSLKAILYKMYLKSEMDKKKIEDKLKDHRLGYLWDKMENILLKNYNLIENNKQETEFKKIKDLVKELHNIDESSMSFRYPFDKSLNEYLYGNGKDNFGVDFNQLKIEMNYIYDRLYYWINIKVTQENEKI